eukprot:Skav200840  [mRNA]  locus=scaffold2392:97612:98361:+ [translate_table: standard]
MVKEFRGRNLFGIEIGDGITTRLLKKEIANRLQFLAKQKGGTCLIGEGDFLLNGLGDNDIIPPSALSVELLLRLRGGGLGRDRRPANKVSVRQVAMKEKKDALQESTKTPDAKMLDAGNETVELAKQYLSSLYERADADPSAVVKSLLGNLPSGILGTHPDESQLMETYKKTRGDARMYEVGNLVMKANFPDLYAFHDEVSSVLETCELTWDVIIHQLVMAEDGSTNWAVMKRMIEDAITIRASREDEF